MEDSRRTYSGVYSKKVRAGKRRTYFFDVRATKYDDYYITITESKRRFPDGGFERHKIFVYKEDFNKFFEGLEETVKHVKNDLMPEYDFDAFDREREEARSLRQEEEQASETEAPAQAVEEAAKEPVAEASEEVEVEPEAAPESPAEPEQTEEEEPKPQPAGEGQENPTAGEDALEWD